MTFHLILIIFLLYDYLSFKFLIINFLLNLIVII
jgi:hypothetical protein